MRKLRLDRPLAVFDLETTGADPEQDRIVEIAVVRVETDGRRESWCRRVHPEMPIPAEATAVHGIGDEDVRDAPAFREVAQSVLDRLAGADLAGFNLLRFDLPLLSRQLRECELDLGLAERRVVDAMAIFHRMERRDLSAAVRFYLGRDHAGAHAADGDALATLDVLEAQLDRYAELPLTVAELDDWTRPARANAVDRAGKLVWREGKMVLSFGKHGGRAIEELARSERRYLEWTLGSDFPDDFKDIVRRVLRESAAPLFGRDQST